MRVRLAHSWVAVALAGALAVLLLATVNVHEPGSGLAPYAGSTLTLPTGSKQEWTYTTERPGLTGVRLWLAGPTRNEASLEVSVLPANNPTVVLTSVKIPLVATSSEGAIEAYFDPVIIQDSPHTPTATLVLRLVAHLPPGAQVAFQGTAEGSAPAFQPFYQARPFDRIWPITAMAYARTGLLGMPSFYALLGYVTLVATIRILWLLLKDLRTQG